MKTQKRNSVGKPKAIGSPDDVWAHFLDYEFDVKSNPKLVHDYVGKDGNSVYREKERPLTMAGFESWLMDIYDISTIQQYLENRDGRYQEYVSIFTRVRSRILQDLSEGGLTGIYHGNLTARIGQIPDKVEDTSVKTVKLLNIDPL